MDKKDNMAIIDAKDAGSVKISTDVVAVIAAIAASDIEGVYGMSNSLADGISEFLGKKNMSKGVKVEISGQSAVVDVYIIVEYGVNISDTAVNVQEAVKKSVETMTGLTLSKINVHIQGINLDNGDAAKQK